MSTSSNLMSRRKKVKLYLAFISLVIILCAIFYIYRSVNLSLKEGMRLSVMPEYSGVDLKYGETTDLDITITVDNYWLCKASCVHEFIDMSRNISFKEEFSVQNHKRINYDAQLSADINGFGQKIYQYRIECRNKA